MMASRSDIAVAVETLLLLVPTTVAYLFILLMGISNSPAPMALSFSPGKLGMLALALFPGWGLFSIWWLALRRRKYGSLREIPKFVWGGLAAGFLVLFSTLGFMAFDGTMTISSLAPEAILALLAAALCAGPFFLAEKAVAGIRRFIWGLLAVAVMLVLAYSVGLFRWQSSLFVGAMLTLVVGGWFLGPFILAASLLAEIRHR